MRDDKMTMYPMYETPSRKGSALLFVSGALAGAAAALLLAPASGRETRAFLGRRGRLLADSVAEHGRQVWHEHGERVAEAVLDGYAVAASRLARPVNGSLQ